MFPVNTVKFLKTPAYGCLWSDFRKWIFDFFFLASRFQNHPDLVILQKYQSLSNQSFKHNSAHMPYLNLTPTISFKARFRSLILTVTTEKNKRL